MAMGFGLQPLVTILVPVVLQQEYLLIQKIMEQLGLKDICHIKVYGWVALAVVKVLIMDLVILLPVLPVVALLQHTLIQQTELTGHKEPFQPAAHGGMF